MNNKMTPAEIKTKFADGDAPFYTREAVDAICDCLTELAARLAALESFSGYVCAAEWHSKCRESEKEVTRLQSAVTNFQAMSDALESFETRLTAMEARPEYACAGEWKDSCHESQGECEQLRVQLAGCLTAADGATTDVAKPGDYGWSPAYQRVLELRRERDTLADLRDEDDVESELDASWGEPAKPADSDDLTAAYLAGRYDKAAELHQGDAAEKKKQEPPCERRDCISGDAAERIAAEKQETVAASVPNQTYCDGCDGTGVMEGWNNKNGVSCPKCNGIAIAQISDSVTVPTVSSGPLSHMGTDKCLCGHQYRGHSGFGGKCAYCPCQIFIDVSAPVAEPDVTTLWQILTLGQRAQPGDEIWHGNKMQWYKVTLGWCVSENDNPIRRRVQPAPCPRCAELTAERDAARAELRECIAACHAGQEEAITAVAGTPLDRASQHVADIVSELTIANGELQLREIARIKYLNRLATWAQQDPTGPWEKHEIQKWVLDQIRGALGQDAKATTAWQPIATEAEDSHARPCPRCDEILDERDELRNRVQTLVNEMERLYKLLEEKQPAPCPRCEELTAERARIEQLIPMEILGGSLVDEATRLARAYNDGFKAIADTVAERNDEKRHRVYYQDIVYSVCCQLDAVANRKAGTGLVCGTVDSPTLRNRVQTLVAELNYWQDKTGRQDANEVVKEREQLQAALAASERDVRTTREERDRMWGLLRDVVADDRWNLGVFGRIKAELEAKENAK